MNAISLTGRLDHIQASTVVSSAPGVSLRPQQHALVSAAQAAFRSGHRSVLVQGPTGLGKTVILAHVSSLAAASGRRVLIVVHRRELRRQASDKLTAAGVVHGIIGTGFPETDDPVQVASIQALANRLEKLPAFDLVVMDEAHHAVAGQWAELLASQPKAFVLGFTATPERLDGRGLGRATGGCFDHLVHGPEVSDLIADGYLVPSRVFAPTVTVDLSKVRRSMGDFESSALEAEMNVPSVTGDAIGHYERHAPRQPAIAFCTSVKHAEDVARGFREAGWRSVCAHGGMRQDDRDAAIAGLVTGDVQVLTCCDLVSEGLDVPSVGAVILLRPTQSLGLFMQQVGRGLRPTYAAGHDLDTTEGRLAAIAASDKPALIVLDHAGNVLRHGLPDTPRTWSLDSRKRKDRGEAVPTTVRCPACFAVQRPALSCEACGFEFADDDAVRPKRELKQVEGTLHELSSERMQKLRESSLSALLRPGMSYAAIDEIRLARGFKRGWTFYRFRELGQRSNGAVA